MENFVYFYLTSVILSAIVCYKGYRYDLCVKGLDFKVSDLIIYFVLVFVPIMNFVTFIAAVFLASKEVFYPYNFDFVDKVLIKGKKND